MSQVRENIEDSEYKIAGWIGKTLGVVLQVSDRYELFFKNDEFAGHVIVIDGQGYEFFREAEPSDLWWAGIKINSPASKPPSINNAIHEKEDKHTQD